jgi:hypothetical protein
MENNSDQGSSRVTIFGLGFFARSGNVMEEVIKQYGENQIKD